MKCPYVKNYECDDCRYCKTEPHKKGGLDNWNMLEDVDIVQTGIDGTKKFDNIKDVVDNFDNNFLGKDENGILCDERIFENGLDGGLMPTTDSLTEDFNRIFGTNYKNIFKGK